MMEETETERERERMEKRVLKGYQGIQSKLN